jgi:inosine-uridine nucleoside N-ribohydrolase
MFLQAFGAPTQLTTLANTHSRPDSARAARARSRRVLLLTDIGRDVDDTVALLTLLGAAPDLVLTGIVTCGGCGAERVRLLRQWLKALGAPPTIAVADGGDTASAAAAHCHSPFAADAPGSGRGESATNLIRRCAQTYGSRLLIVAIGPLGPLAAALEDAYTLAACKRIGGLLIQGQAVPSADAAARLAPSADAFNLREDMEAAHAVFEALQDHVPFTLLGKHAAYRNGLTCEDFRSWSALLRSGAVDLFEMAKDQMNGFRTAAPDAFYKVYAVPPEERTDDRWFCALPNDIICTPYDPLLVLCALRPELFEPVVRAGAGGKIAHTLIGNTAESHGVPDPAATHAALCELARRAFG